MERAMGTTDPTRIALTTRLVIQSRRFFAWLIEPLARVLEPYVTNIFVRNVPNAISVLRAVLGMLASWDIYHAEDGLDRGIWIVAILVLILSDGIDGTLARRLGVTSLFGATFDPFSDKLLVGSLLFGLSLKFESLLFWQLVLTLAIIEAGNVIIGAISGALVNQLHTSEKAGASNIGKVKMGVECLTVFLGWTFLPLDRVDTILCGFLVAVTIPLAIGSLAGYLSKALRSLAALR